MKRRYRIGDTHYEAQLEPGPGGTTCVRIGDHEIVFRLRKLSGATALLERDGFRDEIIHLARDGEILDLHLVGRSHRLIHQPTTRKKHGGSTTETELHAPMPGRIVKVNAAPGDRVETGDSLVVLEAMKMEHHIRAGGPCVVRSVRVHPDDPVSLGALLVELDPLESDSTS